VDHDRASLRHPGWRQDPGKAYRTYEERGRVTCPGCNGKGCDRCTSRGWMIDDNAAKDEWHPHGT